MAGQDWAENLKLDIWQQLLIISIMNLICFVWEHKKLCVSTFLRPVHRIFLLFLDTALSRQICSCWNMSAFPALWGQFWCDFNDSCAKIFISSFSLIFSWMWLLKMPIFIQAASIGGMGILARVRVSCAERSVLVRCKQFLCQNFPLIYHGYGCLNMLCNLHLNC